MTFRSSLFLVATLALVGCSAPSGEEPGSASSDVIVGNGLVDQTIIKGTVNVGETSKVGYEPHTNYPGVEIDGVPYLAWEIVTPKATGGLETRAGELGADELTIAVVGDFPGAPDVVVVDKDFAVLGSAKGHVTALGDEAQVTVAGDKGAKFVLVRDMIWVAPMDFEIAITQ